LFSDGEGYERLMGRWSQRAVGVDPSEGQLAYAA